MRVAGQHHILVVADSQATIDISSALERMGMICTSVPDNQAAIDKMRLLDFDVVLIDLSDVQMACDLLVAMEQTAIKAIPIVLAEVDEIPRITDSVELEAFDFLARPATELLVVAAVHKATKRNLALQNMPAINRLATQWQDVFDAFPDMIIVLHEDGRILRVNPALTSRIGRTKDDLIDQPGHQAICGDTHQPDQCPFNNTGKGGQVLLTEFEHAGWGGAFEVASVALMNGSDNGGSLHIIRDVTERKQVEEQLRNADARNRMLLASISSVLIGLDANRCVTFWNRNAQDTLGVSDDQVIGKQFCNCEVAWDFSQISEGLAACFADSVPVRVDDITFTRPDGKTGILAITINPVKDESSNKPGYLILGREITDRKLLEAQLAQAQKLKGIGQLAAGIAHEINTPMQYFGDNTRFLQNCFDDLCKLLALHGDLLAAARQSNLKPDLVSQLETLATEADIEYLMDEIPRALSQSLDGLGQVTRIVHAMREFSHPGVEEKVLVDINEAIDSTTTVCRNEWKYVAELETDFQENMGSILCLPGELHQVLLNIIVNAAHAIGDVVGDGANGKGTIFIQTRQTGDWINIRISDTGGGIPEEIASKVFDPFFTTKAVGRGTGQGLAIAHTVVTEKHGGTIAFETDPGKGTTFIVRLPVNTESPRSTADMEGELTNVG